MQILSSRTERYVDTTTPVEDRRIAARGAVPLEPLELASVLFALLEDPDEEVRAHATRSLAELPEAICRTTLEQSANPALLAYLCAIHEDKPVLLELAALNAATDDETLAQLAACPHASVVEIISQNQDRLVSSNAIVESLGQNPLTGRATLARILDSLGPGPENWDDEILAPDAEVSEDVAAAALVAVLGEEFGPMAKPLVRDSNTVPSDDAFQGNIYAAISGMSVVQKIKLARYGGSDARGLLIRDRNKVVATAVIRSPKIKEAEVLAIAKSRNVSDEILRLIATHREWTKNYAIKHALATNPKTPQTHALRFLGFLQQRDLRTLAKSRNVPAAISAQARRLLARTNPPK